MKNILTLLALLFISNSFAGTELNCKADRLSKIITISKNHIVMRESQLDLARNVASSNNAIATRTRYIGKTMEKTMFIGGDKYLIHIEDINSYNQVNDYMIIKNRKGHELMFSIDCK